jgi:hypothetical protein
LTLNANFCINTLIQEVFIMRQHTKLRLPDSERADLTKIASQTSGEWRLVTQVKIILLAAMGKTTGK